jgi:redox-sensitive bicupin YhaK (pirin superfamily)
MGFSTLRVINEDKVIPSLGFPPHSHRDMEIISYVVEGELEHKDSLDHVSIIRSGDVQRITAGTGITHSEFNASSTDPVHFLQIWILPNKQGLTPSYEQKYFSPEDKQGKLKLIASPNGSEDSITINQDVNLYAACLNKNENIEHTFSVHRNIWIQMIKGTLNINDQTISPGDGAAIILEENIKLTSLSENTEFLLFDLT